MAPTKIQTLVALLGMSSVHSQSNTQDPITCATNGFTYFLGSSNAALQTSSTTPEFSKGVCCETNDGSAECGVDCTAGAAFCKADATNPISNRFLKEFFIPSDASNCAADGNTNIVVDASGDSNAKIYKHEFSGTLPRAEGKNWHCKWKISANPSLVPNAIAGTSKTVREGNGWLQIEVIAISFDNNVIVIMQPPEGYYEYNYRSVTNNPEKQTFVARSQTNRKYLFPAEYDVLVDVSPYEYVKNSDEQPTTEGAVQIKVTHLTTKPTTDETWSVVDRLEALAGSEVQVVAPDSDASDIELVAPQDDSALPDTKKDFDGNVVSKGDRWGSQTAFTVGGTDITKEQAATASGVVIALIIVIVVMCCFFSYIERKKIAAEGRRLSTAVRRASTKLRRGSAANEEPVKEMTDKDIEKQAAAAAGSKGEKDFLQDQMKFQRDAQASATSLQDNAAAAGGAAKVNQSIEGLPKADADYKDPVE